MDHLLDPELHSPERLLSRSEIVIVDAWVHKSPLHWFWRWYLQRKGFETAIIYLSLRDMSFEQCADAMRRHFEENDLRDAVVVAISSGALVTLLYLETRDGWRRVRQFVSIGAPFRGTETAVLVYFEKHLRALLPNSAFIAKLARCGLRYPERTVNLVATFDELVPDWSSSLPGAQRVVIDVIGHNVLHSLSKATYDEVARLAEASRAGVETGPMRSP